MHEFCIAVEGDQATSILQWAGHPFLAGAVGDEESTLRAASTDTLVRASTGGQITGMSARLRFTTGNLLAD